MKGAATDPEVWRVIPSVPGYLASSYGRVMKTPYLGRVSRGKGLRNYGGEPWGGCWDGSRYIIHIKGSGTFKIARLICEAFHGPAPADKPVCMHLDESSRNNRPENLRWGTQKENLAAPEYRKGLRQRTAADLRKLSAEDVREIRRRASNGETGVSIARDYGISACYASRVINFHSHQKVA